MEQMKKLCAKRFEQFGTAGHADRIKPIPLAEMARRYAAGTLDPVVACGMSSSTRDNRFE